MESKSSEDSDKLSDFEDGSSLEDSSQCSEEDIPATPANYVATSGPLVFLVKCFMFLLFQWYVKFRISDRAMNWLLKLLYTLFVVLGKQQILEHEMMCHFPKNLPGLHNFVNFSKPNLKFSQYTVCPNPICTKLYTLSDIIAYDGAGQPVAVSCIKCGSQLVKENVLANGQKKFHSLKVYCYKSIHDSLQCLLSRPQISQLCSTWKTRKIPEDTMGDIYDGSVWKSFCSSLSSADNEKVNLGLMLNCDWFQPFKRRSNISVGALYAVVVNLPRSMRFKPENVLLLGILPALSKEPTSLNTFLQPTINELKALHRGVEMKLNDTITLTVAAQLLCASSDIPATRKLLGFLGHSAILGCSKCSKNFPTMTFNGKQKRNYSGFNRENWAPRTNSTHRSNVQKIASAKTKKAKQELEKRLGCRYTALLELDYFDPVAHHAIDPMHNLFLGTAKRMFKLWISLDLLQHSALAEIERRIACIRIPLEHGRIPTSISSNYGNFTAAEWKNWTLVYSLYCLQGLLPDAHLACWQTFVLACNILCQPMLTKVDVQKADMLLLKFGRTVESLYTPGVVTPNMHLHGHLAECIYQYGPIASFWLFSFERYNGLLGEFSNNKKNIEMQLMRKFLSIIHANTSQHSLELDSDMMREFTMKTYALETTDSELTCTVYSNDTLTAPFKPVQSVSWKAEDVQLPKKWTFASLDQEDAETMASVYTTLFPKHSFSASAIPLMCKKFSSIRIGWEHFGSRYRHKKVSSCYILASWANPDGTININSYVLRPGEIRYFLHHKIVLGNPPQTLELILAVVQWFNSTSRNNRYFLPPTIEFADTINGTIPSGPASFLPVQRIASSLAVGHNIFFNQPNTRVSTTAKVGVPLIRKNYI